jgi:hypothetical protein
MINVHLAEESAERLFRCRDSSSIYKSEHNLCFDHLTHFSSYAFLHIASCLPSRHRRHSRSGQQ